MGIELHGVLNDLRVTARMLTTPRLALLRPMFLGVVQHADAALIMRAVVSSACSRFHIIQKSPECGQGLAHSHPLRSWNTLQRTLLSCF